MPTNDNTQSIDVTAIMSQITVLKRQRDMANDDVAILFGQVESLKKQLAEVQSELNAAKSVTNANTQETNETSSNS